MNQWSNGIVALLRRPICCKLSFTYMHNKIDVCLIGAAKLKERNLNHISKELTHLWSLCFVLFCFFNLYHLLYCVPAVCSSDLSWWNLRLAPVGLLVLLLWRQAQIQLRVSLHTPPAPTRTQVGGGYMLRLAPQFYTSYRNKL